jgi:uncharacterized DUF497 family protein
MGSGFRWIEWNVDHIAEHDVSPDEAEFVVNHVRPPYPEIVGAGKFRVVGQTAAGRYLHVIFVIDPAGTIFVIHARDLTDSEKRRLRRRRK